MSPLPPSRSRYLRSDSGVELKYRLVSSSFTGTSSRRAATSCRLWATMVLRMVGWDMVVRRAT